MPAGYTATWLAPSSAVTVKLAFRVRAARKRSAQPCCCAAVRPGYASRTLPMSRVSRAWPYAAITYSIAPRGSATAGAAAALGAVSRAARARASRSVSFHNDVTATIRIIASDSRPAVANESAPRSIVSPRPSSA